MTKKKKQPPVQSLLKEAGEKVALYRFHQKMSMDALSEKAGVSGVTISGLEKNNLKNVNLDTLSKIMNACDINLSLNLMQQ